MDNYSEKLKSRNSNAVIPSPPSPYPLATHMPPPGDDSPPSTAPLNSDPAASITLHDVESQHPYFSTSPGPATWKEEQMDLGKLCHCFRASTWDDHGDDPDCGCSLLTLVCCAWAGRVGNMVVVQQTLKNDEPRLLCVLGPFWPVLFFITWPLHLGVSAYTLHRLLQLRAAWYVVAIWAGLTFGLFTALYKVSTTDPGILPRYVDQPDSTWRWNSQANTYRPTGAVYDQECGVVVEGFDHVCPWTGTAIGAKNMNWFQIFVGSVFSMIIVDVALCSGAFVG